VISSSQCSEHQITYLFSSDRAKSSLLLVAPAAAVAAADHFVEEFLGFAASFHPVLRLP
jgi:hypothetical protein